MFINVSSPLKKYNKLFKDLLASNCAATQSGQNKWEELHLAISCQNLDLVKLLLATKHSPNAKTRAKWTPLHTAASHGYTGIAKQLIAAKAEVNTCDIDKWTPLHAAAANRHLEFIQVLIQDKANLNAQDSLGRTALHILASTPQQQQYLALPMIKTLVDNGANFTLKDKKGKAPLVYAKRTNFDTAYKLLLPRNIST